MEQANMKRWSDEKLDREIAFAELALDDCDTATLEWLNQLHDEQKRRTAA